MANAIQRPSGEIDGVRVVVGTARELSGGAAAGVDAEEVMPGVNAIAERVAAVVDLVQHGGARRGVVLDEALGVDIDHRDQAAAVGQPGAGLHLIGQVGQPLGLAAGHRQEPELARRFGVGRAQEGELRAIGRPGRRAVARAGGQAAVVAAGERDGADVGLAAHRLARDLRADVGDRFAVGREGGAAHGWQVEDDLGANRLARCRAGHRDLRSGWFWCAQAKRRRRSRILRPVN